MEGRLLFVVTFAAVLFPAAAATAAGADSWLCKVEHTAGLVFPPDKLEWTPVFGSKVELAYVVRRPTDADLRMLEPMKNILGWEDPRYIVVDALQGSDIVATCQRDFDFTGQVDCSIGPGLVTLNIFSFSKEALTFTRFSHGSYFVRSEGLKERASGPGVSPQGLDLTASGKKGNLPVIFEAGTCSPL